MGTKESFYVGDDVLQSLTRPKHEIYFPLLFNPIILYHLSSVSWHHLLGGSWLHMYGFDTFVHLVLMLSHFLSFIRTGRWEENSFFESWSLNESCHVLPLTPTNSTCKQKCHIVGNTPSQQETDWQIKKAANCHAITKRRKNRGNYRHPPIAFT